MNAKQFNSLLVLGWAALFVIAVYFVPFSCQVKFDPPVSESKP